MFFTFSFCFSLQDCSFANVAQPGSWLLSPPHTYSLPTEGLITTRAAPIPIEHHSPDLGSPQKRDSPGCGMSSSRQHEMIAAASCPPRTMPLACAAEKNAPTPTLELFQDLGRSFSTVWTTWVRSCRVSAPRSSTSSATARACTSRRALGPPEQTEEREVAKESDLRRRTPFVALSSDIRQERPPMRRNYFFLLACCRWRAAHGLSAAAGASVRTLWATYVYGGRARSCVCVCVCDFAPSR